ncbi:hypothetical protein B0H17DRAFT_931689 [Mycena rosella]|uniref:Uncharacterized protein n=1 Tax=Mycena rosella TaxID=1033263 RepID=A0AAD7DLG8_MYCRO|nr:hypothetical protein B0H17DRAFT_931689 [Mycena rosella]
MGRQHNAIFGPAKYQLLDASQRKVPATFQPRKRVPESRFGLVLGAHHIKSATSVKLLSVHLDRELRWKEQGAAALAKGQAWLGCVGRLARASRGIKVGPMRCLYHGTCVPRMLYATDVLLNPHNVKTRHSKNRAILGKLRTIQRCAALAITGALSSTPTDVLTCMSTLCRWNTL